MICERYETVVVPFPFAEIPVRKRRPAVVISGRSFNEANGQTLVAMITTAKETKWPSDVELRDLETAGLHVKCLVRLKFSTLPNDLIARRLGGLGSLDRLACERQIANMLL